MTLPLPTQRIAHSIGKATAPALAPYLRPVGSITQMTLPSSRVITHTRDGVKRIQIITETNLQRNLIKDYIWSNQMMPVAQIDAVIPAQAGIQSIETITYLYTDHLMTARLTTNNNGIITWRWEGEAFGNTPAQELGTVSINLRFPGQYYDSETNLHYNMMRYYDPAIGRYITSDPIGLEAGNNTYLYSGASPTRFLDPLGLRIEGNWILKPRLADSNADLVSIELLDLSVKILPPGISLALINLNVNATAQGVIYCKEIDDCSDEVIRRWVETPTATASDEFKFHAYYRIGPLWWTILWVTIDSAVTAHKYRHVVNTLALKAIDTLMQVGPTAYCIQSSKK